MAAAPGFDPLTEPRTDGVVLLPARLYMGVLLMPERSDAVSSKDSA